MSLLALGSTILALGNLLILWILSHNRRAWAYLACGWQLPSSAYDVITRQYGWLLMVPVGMYLTVKAYKGIENRAVVVEADSHLDVLAYLENPVPELTE